MSDLFDFAVTTIFAREVLEGSIIIGEYRTIIIRGGDDQLLQGFTKDEALRAVTVTALLATAFAILVCVAVAIPLAVLSNDFDDRTSKVIEGVSKIVAAICILQLSLKFPQWLGIYASKKKPGEDAAHFVGLSLSSIRFNVAWNIWREVAECGVFLLPFFLQGEGVTAIPLSAVIGTIVGLLLGVGIYFANKRLKEKRGLAAFSTILLLFMSTGLFTGGCHNLEEVFGSTREVWVIQGDFWSTDSLPMTVLKPFGYSDSRTVLQICSFWLWLGLGGVFHFFKWRFSKKMFAEQAREAEARQEQEVKPPDGLETEIGWTASTEESASTVDNDPLRISGFGDIEDQLDPLTEEAFEVVDENVRDL